MDNTIYNTEFHRERDKTTRYTAKRVLDYLNSILDIKSFVDVGGGVGTWADVQKGINGSLVLVLDGDYISKDMFVIDLDSEFISIDLENEKISQKVQKKFDIAVSLEVAEHLSEKRAASFVDDLCNLSDVILFSAAIPYQGGEGHINEQFLSYWNRLFENEGYELFDIVRPILQNDSQVLPWYRQNIVIFSKKKTANYSLLKQYPSKPMIDIVVPEMYLSKITEPNRNLNSVHERVKRILKKIF